MSKYLINLKNISILWEIQDDVIFEKESFPRHTQKHTFRLILKEQNSQRHDFQEDVHVEITGERI